MANSTLKGQAYQLISTTTFSGASSIEFTNLSSGYAAYRIDMTNVTVSNDGAQGRLRTSTTNGSSYDSGAGHYSWQRVNIYTNGPESGTQVNESFCYILPPTGSATSEAASATIILSGPSAAAHTAITVENVAEWTNGSLIRYAVVGKRKDTTAVDAVQLAYTAGTFSGIANLYGYKNA